MRGDRTRPRSPHRELVARQLDLAERRATRLVLGGGPRTYVRSQIDGRDLLWASDGRDPDISGFTGSSVRLTPSRLRHLPGNESFPLVEKRVPRAAAYTICCLD